MAPLRWSFFAILGGLLLLGLPNEVKLEAPTEETKPSSVKDCKIHIEKALEQYWDQKGSVKSDKQLDQTESNGNPPIIDNDDDDEDDEIPQQAESQHQNTVADGDDNDSDDDDDDDDEDEDEDEDEDKDNETGEANKKNEDEDDDDDDDDDEDNDEDDDDDDEDVTDNETQENESGTTAKNAEGDIDDDDDDDDDVDEDDDDNDDDDNDKDEAANDDDDEERDEEATGDNEDDDEQESPENFQSVIDQNDETKSKVSESAGKEQNDDAEVDDDDDDDDDDDGDDDDDDDEEGDEKNEEAQKGEENKTEILEEDDVEDEKEAESLETTTQSAITDESDADDVQVSEGEDDEDDDDDDDNDEVVKETESDKATGETDRATAGVVSELPETKPSLKQPKTPTVQEETVPVNATLDEQDESDEDDDEENQQPESDKDDDTIENIYEEDDDESPSTVTFRSRDHIDIILGLDEIGTEYDKEEDKLAQSIFREIKKIEQNSIKPMEMLYKYTDSTTRVLGDAEIFNKPMLLFLGPWSAGKTTIINYLLGIERTPLTLKTGTGITDVDFTLITYGDQKQMVSGTELAADWKYAGVQKFGQGFLDHFRSISMPSTLLKKVIIVDTPGILENRKNAERSYPFNDAFQWFIDRADAIYAVLDPTKVDIGGELGSVLDQIKGREVRFILNKADTIRRSDLMRVVGQLFWNLSPVMSSTEAPIIYAVSLTSKPYHPSAPARFLADQEHNFMYDMKDTLDKRVENRILYARRHAVRVRNHAKMVDCYLATYYRHKSIFSNKKNVAKLITENPNDYKIFEDLSSMTNVSRYDLPNPDTYKEFFKLHPLYDFKPLASTCSYFRGCPMDKLDAAIAKEIPELFAKYKKAKGSSDAAKQEGR